MHPGRLLPDLESKSGPLWGCTICGMRLPEEGWHAEIGEFRIAEEFASLPQITDQIAQVAQAATRRPREDQGPR